MHSLAWRELSGHERNEFKPACVLLQPQHTGTLYLQNHRMRSMSNCLLLYPVASQEGCGCASGTSLQLRCLTPDLVATPDNSRSLWRLYSIHCLNYTDSWIHHLVQQKPTLHL